MKSSLETLRAEIVAERPHVGKRSYSHNIISIALRQIASNYGTEAANEAITDLDLEKLGWEQVDG